MKTKLTLTCTLILLAFSCSSAPTVNKGVKLFNEQKYTEAIAVFEKVLEKDPKNIKALYNIAISYIQLKDDNKALIYLNKTAEIDPFQDDAWYNLALIYFKKEDYLSALGAGLDAGPDAKKIVDDSRAKLREKGVVDIIKKIKFPVPKGGKNVHVLYRFEFKHPNNKNNELDKPHDL